MDQSNRCRCPQCLSGLQVVRGLAIDPSDPNTMYAGSFSSGIFKTQDGGQQWTNIGLSDRNIFHIALDPQDPSRILVGSGQGVVRSLDGGRTWADLGQQTG